MGRIDTVWTKTMGQCWLFGIECLGHSRQKGMMWVLCMAWWISLSSGTPWSIRSGFDVFTNLPFSNYLIFLGVLLWQSLGQSQVNENLVWLFCCILERSRLVSRHWEAGWHHFCARETGKNVVHDTIDQNFTTNIFRTAHHMMFLSLPFLMSTL